MIPFIKFLIVVALFCIGMSSFNSLKDSSEYQTLVMRNIGHRVLQSTGDSTSRLLPIKELEKNVFVISFSEPIFIISDSLFSIVKVELDRLKIHSFLAQLKECESQDVFLSFAYLSVNDSLTPCSGRDTLINCYQIVITIDEDQKSSLWIYIISGLLLLLSGYFIWRYVKRPINRSSDQQPQANIGSIDVYFSQNRIVINDKKIALSEKESKLLALLYYSKESSLSREFILKELWGEQGVLVVSKNIDVLVSKLRKKLVLVPNVSIVNVHGVGYKLEVLE